MTETEENPSNFLPIKKERIRLLFPYSENANVKKLGARWDTENKYWYYPSINGKLPEELEKYKLEYIQIDYDDKEYFKNDLKSMKWDKVKKLWMVNTEDYNKFLKLTHINP
jgi:hypothetical protein